MANATVRIALCTQLGALVGFVAAHLTETRNSWIGVVLVLAGATIGGAVMTFVETRR